MQQNKLSTSLLDWQLTNPLMPASGPLVGDAHKMRMIANQGVGAMVTKTISREAAQVPRPCISAGKNHIMNAELWSEYDMKHWITEELPTIRETLEDSCPLIISVGYSKEDMEVLIPVLNDYADAYEVSTHYVGKDLSVIRETVATIRALTHKPFFMKVSPHMPDPIAFCKMVIETGGNGVVAMNSLGPAMTIDLSKRGIVMGNSYGEAWMSGPVIKPLALALVSKIKRAVPECIVIGVGGISTADDVLEFILAGADAVQMLSAAMLKGRSLYGRIIEELPSVLAKYGFDSIEEVKKTELMIGEVSYDQQVPSIRDAACIACGRCVDNCPYVAMSMENQHVTIDETQCFSCHLCKSLCPVGAIGIEEAL